MLVESVEELPGFSHVDHRLALSLQQLLDVVDTVGDFLGGVADLVRIPISGVALDHVLGPGMVGAIIAMCRNSLGREP